MKRITSKFVISVATGAFLAVGLTATAMAATPQPGGTLNFVVASKIPSYDGHQETTFGMVHPSDRSTAC